VIAPTLPVDPDAQGPGPFDIFLFDTATGALVAPVQTAHFGPCPCLIGRESRLTFVDTPGGLTLESFVTLSETDALIVWDATTMTKLQTVPAPASPADALEQVLSFVDSQARPEGSLRIALQVWAEALRDPALAARVEENYTMLRDGLVLACERASVTDADRVGRVLLSLVPGFVLRRLLMSERLSAESFVAEVRPLLEAVD